MCLPRNPSFQPSTLLRRVSSHQIWGVVRPLRQERLHSFPFLLFQHALDFFFGPGGDHARGQAYPAPKRVLCCLAPLWRMQAGEWLALQILLGHLSSRKNPFNCVHGCEHSRSSSRMQMVTHTSNIQVSPAAANSLQSRESEGQIPPGPSGSTHAYSRTRQFWWCE